MKKKKVSDKKTKQLIVAISPKMLKQVKKMAQDKFQGNVSACVRSWIPVI